VESEWQIRVQRLEEAKGSEWEKFKQYPANMIRYGKDATLEQAQAIENEGIGSAQPVVDRYQNFMLSKAARAAARSQRGELIGGANKEAGEAASIEAGLPGKMQDEAQANAFGRQVGDMETLQRTRAALSEASGGMQGMDGALAGFIHENTRFGNSTTQALTATTDQIAALTRTVAALERKVANTPMNGR
jgi:hypothetical protein